MNLGAVAALSGIDRRQFAPCRIIASPRCQWAPLCLFEQRLFIELPHKASLPEVVIYQGAETRMIQSSFRRRKLPWSISCLLFVIHLPWRQGGEREARRTLCPGKIAKVSSRGSLTMRSRHRIRMSRARLCPKCRTRVLRMIGATCCIPSTNLTAYAATSLFQALHTYAQ